VSLAACRRRWFALSALLVALAWAIWLPAAHILGHRDDHEHTPTGVVWHALGDSAEHGHDHDDDHDRDEGEPHDHEADGRIETHDHDDDHDHGGEAETQVWRWPHRPHGHDSALHFGLALLADATFRLDLAAAPVAAAPEPPLPAPPPAVSIRPWAARAPPA
jgi:hypothetical protein